MNRNSNSKRPAGRPGKSTSPKGAPKGKTENTRPSFGKRKPVTRETAPAKPEKTVSDGSVRLNKFLADAGICSRREADVLIKSGVVEINGQVVTELGTKVMPSDQVRYGGDTLHREKLQYVLLNKPKGYISTSDDPRNRRTVIQLVADACKERIYSVGRLDRNTTGLLLFTNDGDMAKKLTHPKHGVHKIYHVTLDKSITKNDLMRIMKGLELEDGLIVPDKVDFVEGVANKTEVGISLHSGKNRIVRRIFEHLGYQVVKLDRVVFANLTKRDLPRGKYRMLTQQEINMLKML